MVHAGNYVRFLQFRSEYRTRGEERRKNRGFGGDWEEDGEEKRRQRRIGKRRGEEMSGNERK